MPTLPSGRRIEFSLDRFHALLARMDRQTACRIAATLAEADDLLSVLDAVHFRLDSGMPYFAEYVAADWKTRATDWNHADRQALEEWLGSAEARYSRTEAIGYIKALFQAHPDGQMPYPYVMACPDTTMEWSRLRQ